MPASSTGGCGGSGLPHVSTGARTRWTCPWRGQPCRRETYFNRLLAHRLPDRAATHCLQMCGLLTDEERAVKERHGSVLAQTRGTCPGCHTARALDHDMNCPKTAWTRTTRHDMIVSCLYLRLSRELNAELEVRRTATSDQNQKPDTWPSTVQGHRRGRHPAPPDGPLLQREAQEVQGRDPPPQVQAAPRRALRGR
ncbi:Hypothetical protein GSB_155404 [Giardia duodenalis]|uniref:Reverse transcriptase/endonuclease n=1 Tax=Giardia intestinalis TaxID=5741 RepID=V6TNK3_GIAIN|nr:Hypothetical protein GSB_155404 [Giardia intestinalis]